jgi:hypothetical protein
VTLFNYVGHGGYNVMADERAFYVPEDLPRLDNEGMLFLLAAFTCDVGVFDRPRDESMAEDLVRLDGKGAIATIAASRGTSSGPNLDLSQDFYANLFSSELAYGTTATFGEALVEAKASVSTQPTTMLYLLFGDPAQKLSLPRYSIAITHLHPDTLQALTVITLQGEVENSDGSTFQDFDGMALVNVFDSYKEIDHVTPDGGKTIHYQLPGAMLFRGMVPVVDGLFQTEFVIPKDITYGGKTGRIQLYVSGEKADGAGFTDSLVTAGGSAAVTDSTGPSIEMTIMGRETSFSEGDYIRNGEVLKATFCDSSGINITGETGHLIVLQMDGNDLSRTDLTSLFVYDEGSYQKGRVEFPLTDIEAGEHTLNLKAWDNYNNASVHSLFLRVAQDDDMRILNVMNYPNPFATETDFTYELTGSAKDVYIKIYTVVGRLVRTLRNLPGLIGFNQVHWEGIDEDGDRLANGVYLYKVIVTGMDGERREHIGRLIVMK